VVLARGEGPFLWDVEGRRYFDMLSAYSAVGQGHCHPRIVEALVAQSKLLTLCSRAFHNDRVAEMFERVAKLTGFEAVLPMNTGAEAVETAIKLIRRWAYERKGVPDDRAEIIVANGNFHGRTTTVISFSDEPDYTRHFGPRTPGFRLVEFGDAAAVERAVGPNTAAVLIEPIQGEGGVRIPPDGYLARLREICDRENVLLCLDEIQTGLGRTGKMFAWQHEGVRPDVILLGKALSGGLYPVSAACADRRVMDVLTPGSHGSTYGGNPLAAAVTLAALDVIEDEGLPERAAELGAHALGRLREGLRDELRGDGILEIRGRGLMIAVEYREPIAARVAAKLAESGILVKDTRKTIVRLLPPLVITKAQLDEALDIAIPVLQAK
ncbi:MAG: ornithine--oxo-acid transaminase, partial [Sandaracinaceae bacterium]|nr:ornithine--oxo-acid transaminase [Sandaracinaceae bacterium]